MGVTFVDYDELRTIEEFEEALNAVQKEFIALKFAPLMIHYPVIMDALKELIFIRKKIEKGD